MALTKVTGKGLETLSDGVTITTADNDPQLTLICTDADGNEGPVLNLYRNSASPADGDNGPRIKFTGKNDAGQDVEYTRLRFNISDVTDGTEDGNVDLAVMTNGSLQNVFKFDSTEAAFNDGSVDRDFRVESDGHEHMLFVDGGANVVNIGHATNTVGANNGRLMVGYEGNVINGIKLRDSRGQSGTNGAIVFIRGDSEVGSITTTTSATAYNTSSDYRLKENVDYTWNATTRLKQLKPARFNFIADDTNTLVDGFIAHEVSSIVPEAISGAKNAMAVETRYTADDVETQGDTPSKNVGDPKTYSSSKIDSQGIDQSKLVPLLVKTIQELEARITALEA